jgi:hypothetical protein
VHQGGHVHEFHSCAAGHGSLAVAFRRRRGEEDEEWPQTLAARGQRVGSDVAQAPRIGGDGFLQPLLEELEVALEARSLADRRQRAHRH